MQAKLDPAWWGDYSLPEGTTAHWRLGPLRLWLQRQRGELLLAAEHGGEVFDTTIAVEMPAVEPAIPPSAQRRRFGFSQASARIQILPIHADRPLVVNPDPPFMLPAGEEASVYIRLPLWVRILAGDNLVKLMELPVQRLSDTWFGSPAGDGELCYSGGTLARRELTDPPGLPMAFALVRIRNRANEELPLSGLRLPLPQLSLFAGADGRLWSETVLLTHEEEGDLARLELEAGAPTETGPAEAISPPRAAPSKGVLVRSFGTLLRMGGEKLGDRLVPFWSR